ncbi:MAG: transposase [Pseudomonadales bacterium]|nr:transposase [Pseudomonadales bacterium]
MRSRQYPADQTVHVVHRGVERRPVFVSDADRRRFLEELRHAASRHQVDIHAYVLMDNHFHLLATPRAARGVSWMIRDCCRRFVPAHNRMAKRVGTLWSGRHWSSPISTDRHVLACSRYIELNPVRAGLIRHPGGYRWSSHARNAFGKPDSLVTEHPTYVALGADARCRREAYARLFIPEVVDAPETQHEWYQLRKDLRERSRQDRAQPQPNLNG